jgi:hypothetical protein
LTEQEFCSRLTYIREVLQSWEFIK